MDPRSNIRKTLISLDHMPTLKKSLPEPHGVGRDCSSLKKSGGLLPDDSSDADQMEIADVYYLPNNKWN